MTRIPSTLNKVFTPSYADAENTNAQNLTVKEIVARLPEDEFHVTMLCEDEADSRIASRRNTRLYRWSRHANTVRLLRYCFLPAPDIYFFPRSGPIDRVFLDVKKRMKLSTALISYVVMAVNQTPPGKVISRCIREGDFVFGNSNFVSGTIRESFGVSAGTIYDGIDRRFYFAGQKRCDNPRLVVLYAGSFQSRKRVELVIQQAARLPAVNFRLAGAGSTERNCRDLARQLGCSNVTFLGHLSSAELGSEMRAADVFFFPSILEGNPQVLLQASACGLPSIAMHLYQSDYVVDGRTGFLARSDEELSKTLDLLLADSNLRRSFAVAAINHARQFDWDEIAEQWANVFRQAVRDEHTADKQKVS